MNDQELNEHGDRLRIAWTVNSTARIGAQNVASALLKLRREMDDAEAWFKNSQLIVVGEMTSEFAGWLFQFHLQMANCGSQWLETAQGYSVIPGLYLDNEAVGPDELFELRNEAYSRVCLAVAAATDLVPALRAPGDTSAWLMHYLHVVGVQSLFVRELEGSTPSLGALKGRVDERSLEILEMLVETSQKLSETADVDGRRPWCLGAIARMLYLVDDPRAARLTNLAMSLSAANSSNEVQTLHLAMAGIATDSEFSALLNRMTDVNARIGSPFSPERLGELSKITGNARNAAVSLIRQNRIADSLAMLNALDKWSFPRARRSDVTVLRLIDDSATIIGILESVTAAPKVFEIEVSREVRSHVWNLAQDGSEEGVKHVLAELATELSTFLRNDALKGHEQIAVVTYGLCSWIPWSSLASDGMRWGDRTFISRGDVPVIATDTVAPDLLIIDTSFPTSHAVLKAFEAYGSSPRTVVQFNSSGPENEHTKKKILSALEKSANVLFYTHGVSNLMDSSRVGIPLNKKVALSSYDVANLSSAPDTCLIIGCQTGRTNPFIQGTSLADAFIAAGSYLVVSTLWPIQVRTGSQFAVDYLSSPNYGYQLASELKRLQKLAPYNYDGFQLFG